MSGATRRRVLVLSSSLLTDRVLLYTDFLEALARTSDVTVWAASYNHAEKRAVWNGALADLQEFPPVRNYREFPYNYARRLNERVWDLRLEPPSRLSMERHVRRRRANLHVHASRLPAPVLAALRLESGLERATERLLLTARRSPEADERLRALRPDLVVVTGPFWFLEPAVVAAAKRLGIPVVCLIPSWDNLSTKGRLVFSYDGFVVWSDEARRQLHEFYPSSRSTPVRVVGAPQFDILFKDRFYRSREESCGAWGLRPDLPIVLHAVGSPNFLNEKYGALDLAARVARGDLGDVQLLVRPHPIHDNAEMNDAFGGFGPRVTLQHTSEPRVPLVRRSQTEAQVVDWINTFRHANVVVNLSSTVALDAAFFDRPVVNLDFDPEPGQRHQALVHDINHLWTHFRPVAESGALWLAKTPDDVVAAIRAYLEDPGLHREERRRITEFVCGFTDGRSAVRLADAVAGFAEALGGGARKCA